MIGKELRIGVVLLEGKESVIGIVMMLVGENLCLVVLVVGDKFSEI